MKKMRSLTSKLKQTLFLFSALAFGLMSLSPSVVSALSQSDLHSIYNDSVWYRVGGGLADEGFTCGGVGDGTLDSFLKALAYLESGGDPTALNPSGASGKYQYFDGTWQSWAKKYYPPASQYPKAMNAPESYQDAVAYLEYTYVSLQFKGDVLKMAVWHYYPAALDDPTGKALDEVPPYPGNILTPREYANEVIKNMSSPKAQALPLKYAEAPNFQAFLAKVGTPQISSVGCTCSSAIVAMAKYYSWPIYQDPASVGPGPGDYAIKKPTYDAAIKKAQANGEFVGGLNSGVYAGVDCGGFTTRVMRDSGADPKYNSQECNTNCQYDYLVANPNKYQNLGPQTSTKNLQPGDIAIIADTHTYFYVGDNVFKGYNSASSSISGPSRAPMASNAYFDQNGVSFIWFRPKCNSSAPVPGAS